ncbi:hypothetical protein ACFQGT_10065 [Natrialbaceae archaeon GCM10025810]|uniref:DUF7289 family protein n=1 Tax=Halovalidus salilacus TaxID=3075124 RepID=UPI0036152568
MRGPTRGQSTLIGFVLLVGLVAVGGLSLMIVGEQASSAITEDTEIERVEQSFVQLSHETATVTRNNEKSEVTALDAGDYGAIVRENTGSYNVTARNTSDDGDESVEVIEEGTIGTMEYEHEDGTKIAYEGGGAFRETGSETRVVSSPLLNYNHESETLNFPMITVQGDKKLSSGDVIIEHLDATRNDNNSVKDKRIYVEIESEYCRGWETFFDEQAGGTSVTRSCDEGDEGTVEARFGYDDAENAFEDGVSLPNGEGSIGGKDQHSPFDDVEDNEFPPLDETIQLMLEDDDAYDEVHEEVIEDEDLELSDGMYYVEGIGDDGSIDFNLSDDDAVLVVNGSIETQTEDDGISVSDCGDDGDNQLRVYLTGDLDMDNGGTIAPECGDNETIQVYGSSETGVNFGNGNPTFEGLLYVASDEDEWEGSNSDEQVYFQGDPTFEGAIIAESVYVGSEVHNVEASAVDDSEVDVIPEGYEPAPQITYLNVIEHQVSMDDG